MIAFAPQAHDQTTGHDDAPAPSVFAAVAQHRLFVPFVTLWSATLLGLAVLAVPGTLLERLVTACGLPALVPALAAPLGLAARGAIALAASLAGALVGSGFGLAARHLAGPDFGETGDPDGAIAVVGLRRPIMATEPGEQTPVPARVRARDAHPDAPPRRPLVASTDLEALPLAEPVPDHAPVVMPAAPVAAQVPAPFAPPLPSEAATEAPFAPGLGHQPAPFGAPLPANPAPSDPAASAPFARPIAPVPLPCDPALPDPAPLPAVMAAAPFAAPAAPPPQPRAQVEAAPLDTVALDTLGLVQMVERLAMAIERRRQFPAAAPAGGGGAPEAAAFAAPPRDDDSAAAPMLPEASAIEPDPAEQVVAFPARGRHRSATPTPGPGAPTLIEPPVATTGRDTADLAQALASLRRITARR